MPKFFFDLYDGDQFAPDSVGIDLPDIEHARREATRTLSEIASQEIPDDGPRRFFRIVVLDAARAIVSEARIDFHATQSADVGSTTVDAGEDDGG
jgi:hypothetical protein